ncbi:MAG TPA: hypothetical protein VI215_11630 [Bacteroidota bacterium]
MRHPGIAALCALLLTPAAAFTQEQPYSIALFGTFISSSKLFHHPEDPDQIIRSQFLPLDDIFSAGIDLRRNFDQFRVQVGLSAEYISKNGTVSIPVTSTTSIPAQDGFTAIPIELSGYFLIPLGDSKLQIYMGGGGGIYLGTRSYRLGGAEAPTVERNTGYGIHVLSGIEYWLRPAVSLRSDLKFRDVQFETVNRFETLTTTYLGRTILLDQAPLQSRVSIDGMTVTLGIVVHF